MASFVYNKGAQEVANGGIDLLTDTVKAILVGTGYTPNRDHDFVDEAGANDVVDHELNGTGYAGGFGGSGRKALANKSVTEEDANDRAVFDADDLVWAGIDAGTIAGVVLVEERTNDADTPLLAFLDIADLVTNGGDFTLQFDATGIIHFSTV